MSLHYIIDGYNVIKQVSCWKHKKLKEARDSFVRFIYAYRLGGSRRNSITIVFDGKNNSDKRLFNENLQSGYRYGSGTDVIFAKNITADEAIIEIFKKAFNPKNVVVVSDDRQLRLDVRSRGGQLMSVEGFLSRADKFNGNSKGDNRKLSAVEERQINEELARIWLREK